MTKVFIRRSQAAQPQASPSDGAQYAPVINLINHFRALAAAIRIAANDREIPIQAAWCPQESGNVTFEVRAFRLKPNMKDQDRTHIVKPLGEDEKRIEGIFWDVAAGKKRGQFTIERAITVLKHVDRTSMGRNGSKPRPTYGQQEESYKTDEPGLKTEFCAAMKLFVPKGIWERTLQSMPEGTCADAGKDPVFRLL